MALFLTLDWLSVTFKEITHASHVFTERYADISSGNPEPSRFGYTSGIRTTLGVVRLWNDLREGMGVHISFSGSALRAVCEQFNIQQKVLLKEAVDAGGKVSRLDIAKDVKGQLIDESEIYAQAESGKSTGHSRAFSIIKSSSGGVTVYVGSRQSERFMRIYDKGSEQGDNLLFWHRMEIECKGDVAKTLARVLAETDEWEAVFDRLALQMIDIPECVDFQRFFTPEGAQIGLPKIEKRTDREKWIKEQVIVAVVTHYMEHADSEAVALLIKQLKFIDEQREQ